MKEEFVRQFGTWVVSRCATRKDGSRPWMARKDNLVLIEETWEALKERIQNRGAQ